MDEPRCDSFDPFCSRPCVILTQPLPQESEMPETMSPRERVQATIRGAAVDRPAWSLWRHFYETEATPEGLAQSMLGFQETYQLDFMKVNPRASYHVEDWGLKIEYSGTADAAPRVVD